MYPANNPNYTFPWGMPQPNRNLNPFPPSPSNLFGNNFAENGPASNGNGDFPFQPRTNTWHPSPWTDNSYPPQPRGNPWNQWGPSPQHLASLPRPPSPQSLMSYDLRDILLKKRQQCQNVKKTVKNSVTTSQKSQSRQLAPTTTSSQTSQPKQQVPTGTDTTIKVSVLRNYTIPSGITPSSKNKKVRPHFLKFKGLLNQFMVNPSSLIFGGLVKELFMCSKSIIFIEDIEKFIHATLFINTNPSFTTKDHRAPHFRMRIFWLLGEIFRPEYDKIFGTVRHILKADKLFQEFLRMYPVENDFTDELQAIWFYWKSYLHKTVMDRMAQACLNNSNRKNVVNSIPDNATLLHHYAKIFGNAILTPTNDVRPPKPIPIVFDVKDDSRSLEKMIQEAPKKKVSNANLVPLGQKQYETTQSESNQVVTHNYNWPSQFSLSSGTSITPAKPKPAFHLNPQESMNFKIAKLLLLIDKLVTVDRTGVPKAASELMFCFLEHGSDHQLSDRISKETTKSLQEICNNSKIIRVLWVIGYLFFPKYETKLTALKPLLEKTAARLFWICLSKTHRDTTTRDEMRVIFKLWREIAPEEIISSITVRIKDTTASDREANMDWILNDKNIRKGTRIVDFYNNKYLMNALTAGPKSKIGKNQAKEKNMSPAKDSDNEIIILDKCDVIQPTTSNQQKNWEDKLATKQKSDESLDGRPKLKKRKKVIEEEANILFTEFLRIPSKQVNLVKPVLRKEATIDDSTETGNNSMFSIGSSGSGNQEHQQSCGISKLELFRKKMEKDQAIASIGGGHRWNDTSLRENKEIYLRQDWTIDEFVYCVCSEEFQTSWDIVKLNGALRVKIMRK